MARILNYGLSIKRKSNNKSLIYLKLKYRDGYLSRNAL